MSLSNKYLLLLFFTFLSIVGFMIKLPSVFSEFNRELHALFYLCATLVLTLMFPNRWTLIGIGLLIFGILIEFAQEFSNKISIRLIGKRIHGEFDIVDVKYNLFGIVVGLFIFLGYRYFVKAQK